MWIFLSKKIAIPNGVKLKSISWNTEEGWIACGGEQGLLKVLKLETAEDSPYKGIAAPNNLTMNQTLEGHKGKTTVVSWNENFRKLTSSDDNGLIIVWLLHKGMWFEEMINNRNQSVVRDLKWTADGEKICIVYEDGAVIVGSVDGNRLWGKELKTSLSHVEWSPDGKYILFGTITGQVKIFDSKNGTPSSDIKITCLEEEHKYNTIAGIDWYDGREGYCDINAPALAICYENGRCQLMRTELDENPVLVDTGMKVTKIKWNCQGTILAICGSQDIPISGAEVKSISVVQFYSPFGQHLKTLKVPGTGVAGISWEGTGLRLALAADSFVFFANVRPDYKWAWFNKSTLVYSFTKLDRPENCVVFWNSKSEEKYVKYIKRLVAIRAAGEHCILVTKTDHMQQSQEKKYVLIICNSIGSPLESKYLSIEPTYLSMTSTHVVLASDTNIYIWQYRKKHGQSAIDMRKEEAEYCFHIDDTTVRPYKGKFRESETSDTICAIFCAEKYLFIARESGTIFQYSLHNFSLVDKFVLKCRPQVLAVNCDSSKLSIIDINGVFTLYKLNVTNDKRTKPQTSDIESFDIERKEVWDMIWSEDNPELFAIMEKTKMYTFRGILPEEPQPSSAYLCAFSNLKIKAVLLDEIMGDPDRPTKENIMRYETRSLRDTQKILSSVSLEDAFVFVKDNPHPRLFKLLAEAALQKLEFDIAHKAFIHSSDYQGVQFVKKLREFKDRLKQQAEIAAYFKNFEEAERIYKSIDRRDLAIEMRREIGDWFGVLQLLKEGGGDDDMKKEVYNQIGDYFSERHAWNRALQNYMKSDNYEKLVLVYYKKEDFKSLEKLVSLLPESHPLLLNIAEKFAAAGIAQSAVKAFLRAGDVKKAIDTCVDLNLWDKAVELAEKNNMKEVEEILFKYANLLVEKGMIPEAIELYQKANRNKESAKLLSKLSQEAANVKLQPMKAKMFAVFAALEVESMKRRMLDTDGASQTVLKGLMDVELATGLDKSLDNAWRSAEAYHFYMLCQRQLGQELFEDALNTALRLTQYEDILNTKDMYSLIALATFYAGDFKNCSRAFIKLDSYQDSKISTEEQMKYKDHLQSLAVNIFTKHPPTESSINEPRSICHKCSSPVQDHSPNCYKCHTPFYACIASGRNIFKDSYWSCTTCKHRAFEEFMYKRNTCPLCHASVDQ